MLKLSLLATLLLTAVAAADVTLVSACPNEIKVRVGEREEALEPRQSLTVALPESVVVAAEGKTLYTARVTDNRFWVLTPQRALEAGVREAGKPRGAVGFFNATPYSIVLYLSPDANKGEPDPEPIQVPSMQVSRPLDLASAEPYSIILKDDRGNPLGTCWTHARGGNFYLVYRKRNTLYDLDTLGLVPATVSR